MSFPDANQQQLLELNSSTIRGQRSSCTMGATAKHCL